MTSFASRIFFAFLCGLAALSATADPLDVGWYFFTTREGRPMQASLHAVGELTEPLVIDWEARFPRGEPSRGSVTVTPEWTWREIMVNIPNDESWSGHSYQAEFTVRFRRPPTGELVTKVAAFEVTDDDYPDVTIDRQILREGPGEQTIELRLSNDSLIPLTLNESTDIETADWDDFQLLGPVTVQPGERVIHRRIRVPDDGIAEGAEVFYLRFWPASPVPIAIVDSGLQATLKLDSDWVFSGDDLTGTVELPFDAPWRIVTFMESTPPIVRDHGLGGVVRSGERTAILSGRTLAPGRATIIAKFEESANVDPALAEVNVWGGAVTIGDGSGLQLELAEIATLPIHIQAPPPEAVHLMMDSSALGIVEWDRHVLIDGNGNGAVTVTGLAPGKVSLGLFSPAARSIVSEIDVEVVHTMTLSAIAPRSGPQAGGTEVTITGKGFVAPCSMRLGTAPAAGITIVNQTTIRAVTPSQPAGSVDAEITCAGTKRILPAAFWYVRGRSRSVRH